MHSLSDKKNSARKQVGKNMSVWVTKRMLPPEILNDEVATIPPLGMMQLEHPTRPHTRSVCTSNLEVKWRSNFHTMPAKALLTTVQ